jgi:glycosyltransferase involved in cell wall biosynthesis
MSLRVLTAEEDFRARVVIALPEGRPRPVIDIVVPVHDGERDLARTVRRLHAYLTEGFPFTVRITIADNASTDRTLAIATELAAELPEVRVLHLNEKGRGRALAAAWLTSDARVVTHIDVDLSTDPSALLPLVAPVISGRSEISIGSGGRLKALRADVARRLVPLVLTRNWLFDMELLLRAERAGLSIARFGSS